jgi:hypothetical protein
MEIPYTEDDINRASCEAVEVMQFEDAYIRPSCSAAAR